MPKITVNGVALDAPAGMSAIDAVFQAGFDVPYFCAHDHLSPVGACRLCLVEAGSPRKNPDGTFILGEDGQPKIFYFPKPVASCTMAVSEGMVIKTTTEAVAQAQAGMMEFTLLNHPLDCPACDKGGACPLQDRSFEYGAGESRFEFTRRHTDKHHALSEFIVLDRERCIHCKRCVRYFEEIPGQEVLDFVERGVHTFIGSAENQGLGEFSGNINDICPVGALLDETSRFRGRDWEYEHTRSTCTQCPVGCSVWLDARTGRLERIHGAENEAVNQIWLCDAGRFGHEYVDGDARVRQPLVRRDGRLEPATWDQAVAAMKAGLSGIAPERFGLYLDASLTLEEGASAVSFAATLGTPNLDFAPRSAAVVSGQNRASIVDVAHSDAILVIGADVTEEAPVLSLRIQEALKGVVSDLRYNHGAAIADLRLQERMLRTRSRLAVFTPVPVALDEHAGVVARYPWGQEAQLLQDLLVAKSSPGNGPNAQVSAAAAMLAAAKAPVIILGAYAMGGSNAPVVVAAAERLGAKLLVIPAGANAQGLELLGVAPGKNGRAFGHFDGLKAAFLSGLDPDPVALKFLDFLIIHSSHLTGAARAANVVLPAKTNYEKRGTTVNLEGRFLPLQAAAIDGGQAEDLHAALAALSEALGVRPEVRGLRSARKAILDRFGIAVETISPEGAFAKKRINLGPNRPVESLAGVPGALQVIATPRAWKGVMLDHSERARRAVGPDVLRVRETLGKQLGLDNGRAIRLNIGGREQTVTVVFDPAATLPTIPAFDGLAAGRSVALTVPAPATGGDD